MGKGLREKRKGREVFGDSDVWGVRRHRGSSCLSQMSLSTSRLDRLYIIERRNA